MESLSYTPLVSVVVVTYNSSRFLLEALEAIKAQTYRNIELIITDDCSKDDTVRLCGEWLGANEGRFVSSRVMAADKNGGLTVNCNKGVSASKGDWLKLIAGDDILLPNCIEDNVRYVLEHPHTGVVFSGAHVIDDESSFLGMHMNMDTFFSYSPARQLAILLNVNCVLSCTMFLEREMLLREGGFDNAYPMLEDHPLWIRLLKKDYSFGYFSRKTVCYRVHASSVSNGSKKRNPVFVKSWRDFARNVRLPEAKKISTWLFISVQIDLMLFSVKEKLPTGFYKLMFPVAYFRAYWYYVYSFYSPFKRVFSESE